MLNAKGLGTRSQHHLHRRAVILGSIVSLLASLLTFGTHSLTAHAAAGDIRTIAGNGSAGYTGDGGPASAAQLNQPTDFAVDAAGNTYIADVGNSVVRKIDTAGIITTFAGNNTTGFSGDGGPATSAELNQPFGLVMDSAGNLYIADQGVNRIRKVDTSGVITTFAGNGSLTASPDGTPAASAGIGQPQYMAITPAGFFFTDDVNSKVWKIDSSGILTTVASGISEALGLTADNAGNLYVTSFNGDVVDKIDTAGHVTVVAGNGLAGRNGDGGPAASAQLNGPYDVVANNGSLYFSEWYNSDVRKVDASGTITTIAGTGSPGYSGDGGPATAAQLSNPTGVKFSSGNDLLIADLSNNAARAVAAVGPDLLSVSNSAPTAVAPAQTFAYTINVTNPGGAGTATGVTLSDPLPSSGSYVSATATAGTCSQSSGTVSCAIGTLSAGSGDTVTITVTAPNGTAQLSNTATVSANETDPAPGDNSATALTLVNAMDLALTATGAPNVVPIGGTVNYSLSVSNAGPANATGVSLTDTLPAGATFQSATASQGSCTPAGGVVTCALGSVAVGPTATVAITVAAPTTGGPITDQATVTAANPDLKPGNNAASVQTSVLAPGSIVNFNNCCGNGPEGVAEDSAGNVYVAYYFSNDVYKIDTSGNATLYAGTGGGGSSGDGGPATSAQLNQPLWLSFDAAGDLLIDDFGNHEIRSVNASGIITTVAGNGSAGYSGDGRAATSAQLNGPQTVRGLPGGGFLIGDTGNNVVRKVDATGTITTIAGTGTAGFSGDGGVATSAELNSPEDATYDSAGNLLIADCSNQRVRRVDATTGTISTIAGTGTGGHAGDGGPALGAELNCPTSLTLWGGSLYVSNYSDGDVQKIDPSGTITAVWGQGVGGNFNRVTQVWPDASGRLFIADWWDRIIDILSLGPDLLSVGGTAPAGVALGQTFTYTFTVGNPGGAGTATGVSLSDPLPAGVTFVSASAGSGTCSQSGGTVTCNLGQLAPGDATTVTVTATAPATGSGSVSNTATVTANQPDPTPANNSASLTTALNAADLSVTGSGSPATVAALSTATHTFTVSSGGSNATGVTLAATLTQSVAIQSVSVSQGSCTPTGSTVNCQLGTIGPGATATVSITIVPPPTVPLVTDTATVASPLADPNPSNNTATVQTTVTGAIGDIFSVAGDGQCCSGGNGGPATAAPLYGPSGVAEDSAGNVYIADFYACTIRKVDTSGIITIYAGDPQDNCGYAGDGGPATGAKFNNPVWLSFDAAGDLLIADVGNNAIRSINPTTGIITTVAGTGTGGYTGDGGAATSAELNGPQSVRGLTGGGFLIGDTSNNVVRKVDASGKITTIAGNGTAGFSGDGGAATSAQISSPQDTAYDPAGNLDISDCGNQVIRQVNAATGNISTIAGTPGSAGYSGDGGPATSAQFSCPNGLALDNGNIYVSDYGNNVVRRIDTSGTITTVAGNGNCCGGGDGGPATQASFGRTQEIWLDTSANMFIADFFGREIREVAEMGQDLLSVSGSGPLFVGSGSQFTYTFHVTNPGTEGPATGVTFTDPLPAGVTFVSATTSQGGCTPSSGTVTCVLGQMPAGAFETITITVNAGSQARDITNTATVSANETDPALGNNSASVLSHVGEVDLSLSQTGPKPVLLPLNQPATFSMTVGSRGAATGVTLKDVLPSSLKFVSATASQGTCSAANGTVTCTLGAIPDSGSATVTLKVTPISGAGKITNTATVSATQPDINKTNNTASAAVYVNPASCGQVITKNTTLNADIGPCFGDGVIIGADGITLNLNGHSIIGDALQLDDMAGIRVPLRTNVTIENGGVTGFDDGIFVNSGGGNTITNMNVHDNIGPSTNANGQGGFPDFGDGILLQHSMANKVLNSTITHNGLYDGVGIFGLDADFNLIQGNTISKNTNGADGIALSAFLELGDPRRLQSLYENNIIGNTIDDNDAAGITSVGNINSKYLNNDIERNGLNTDTFPLNGIGLQPENQSNHNLNEDVENNKVIGNGQDGIQTLEGARGSLIKNNTVEGNDANHTSYGFDLHDFSVFPAGCQVNTWTGNTYSASGGVQPSCLASTNTLAPGASTSSAPAQGGVASKVPHSGGKVAPRGRTDTSAAPPAQSSPNAAAPTAPAASSSSTPACGAIITASVTLTADLGPCFGPGLIVGADHITINLGGHKIIGGGLGDGMSPGVLVIGHQGVTVTNGSISNFDAGVAIYMGAYDTVSNLNIHDNIGPTDPAGTIIAQYPNIFPTPEMSEGIGVYHSFATQVLNNTLTHNGVHAGIGVYGVDTNATVIKGNTVTNTVGTGGTGGIGIDVSSAFEANDDRGYLPISANNILNNTVTGSQGAGIVSLGNVNGTIRGNVVKNNGVGTSGAPRDGIQLTFNTVGGGSPGTTDTVISNTVSGNGNDGIAVYSGGNTIQSNTVTGDNVNNNGSFDLFDSHPTCDHNTWMGNTAGSAGVSPSCA